MKTKNIILGLSLLLGSGVMAQQAVQAPEAAQGCFFTKKQYVPSPLPKFDELRGELPSPIFDEKPEWVQMYWKAWELGCKNFNEPKPGSGMVTQFIDAAFSESIYLWDTCFMTMFCNVAHPLVPGIGSLDNFYARQYADGEIGRETNRTTGAEFAAWVNNEHKPLFSRWGWTFNFEPIKSDPVIYVGRAEPQPPPNLTLDSLNHPIFSWAEMESYRFTGDKQRFRMVYDPLVHYYRALEKYLQQGNGLYITDWASMDNSPRNLYLKGGGCGVDISCEMVMFAQQLATMAGMLGKPEDAKAFTRDADRLKQLINRLMWDEQRNFYFDLTLKGERAPVKSVAAYWTLLARVASLAQANALVAELKNPATFARMHRVPTLAADEKYYDPAGGYWRGAVWAPTTTMVIRGLDDYGYDVLAREIALNHLDIMGRVFKETGTVWENYAPDSAAPGKVGSTPAVKDMVGWSGLGPILYLLEYAIGLKPNAPGNELTWNLRSNGRQGCERFRFAGHVVSLLAEADPLDAKRLCVTVKSDGAFKLRLVRDGRTQIVPIKETGQDAPMVSFLPRPDFCHLVPPPSPPYHVDCPFRPSLQIHHWGVRDPDPVVRDHVRAPDVHRYPAARG